jgi:hypothetical protein
MVGYAQCSQSVVASLVLDAVFRIRPKALRVRRNIAKLDPKNIGRVRHPDQ